MKKIKITKKSMPEVFVGSIFLLIIILSFMIFCVYNWTKTNNYFFMAGAMFSMFISSILLGMFLASLVIIIRNTTITLWEAIKDDALIRWWFVAAGMISLLSPLLLYKIAWDNVLDNAYKLATIIMALGLIVGASKRFFGKNKILFYKNS